jgi:two-component system chemotaxis response regulator CheY
VHLIISDYSMPGMNGLEFLSEVRSDPLLSKIVFIMLTGSGDGDLVRRAEELRANAYIMKPVSQQQLHDKIAELFGRLTDARIRSPRPAHAIAIAPTEMLPL